MRKIIGFFLVLVIFSSLFLALAILKQRSAPVPISGEFAHNLALLATERVGEPIEGFDANFYLIAFPGLIEADFSGVETEGGRIIYAAGKLSFLRGFGRPVTTADEAITPSGYNRLLKNLRLRLGNLSTDELIVSISGGITSFEECAAAGYPIAESYPRQCRTSDGSLFIEEIEAVACTADAMICPDGSYVGRVGPDCEFAACPSASVRSGSIRGIALIGPTCSVVTQTYPPDPNCDDKPYSGTLAVTSPDGDAIVSVFAPSSDGTFSVNLSEGEYAIRSAAGNNRLPRCSALSPVVVAAGFFTEVQVYCDSGLR